MKEKLLEKAGILGDYYLDPQNKVEFVIHRKKGSERFIVDRQQVKDYMEGKAPFIEFAKVLKK